MPEPSIPERSRPGAPGQTAAGAYRLKEHELKRLERVIFTEMGAPNKPGAINPAWIGKDATALLAEIGVEKIDDRRYRNPGRRGRDPLPDLGCHVGHDAVERRSQLGEVDLNAGRRHPGGEHAPCGTIPADFPKRMRAERRSRASPWRPGCSGLPCSSRLRRAR